MYPFVKAWETLKLFFQEAFVCLKYVIAQCFASHAILYIALPIFSYWLILDLIDGPHSMFANQFEFAVKFIVWWLGLGIFSSI
jgi:hypothetical protein